MEQVKWTDVGRPDFTNFYEHINDMLLKSELDSVDVSHYIADYDNADERFNAMVALTNMASDGIITIITYRQDNQEHIRSFQLAT